MADQLAHVEGELDIEKYVEMFHDVELPPQNKKAAKRGSMLLKKIQKKLFNKKLVKSAEKETVQEDDIDVNPFEQPVSLVKPSSEINEKLNHSQVLGLIVQNILKLTLAITLSVFLKISALPESEECKLISFVGA